jgi:hypothetical protein
MNTFCSVLLKVKITIVWRKWPCEMKYELRAKIQAAQKVYRGISPHSNHQELHWGTEFQQQGPAGKARNLVEAGKVM